MMKNILGFVAVALLMGTGVSEATVGARQTKRQMGGGITQITLVMPSQAQNAIDTSYVDISDADWSQLSNATVASSSRVLSLSIGASFATSQDSVNTQIGQSADGVLWTDAYSLANTGSNLTTSANLKAIPLAIVAPFLRVIVKNVDATTGAAKVTLVYPSKR